MQVPEYVGCPLVRLKWLVVNHIARMRARAQRQLRAQLPSQRDMSRLESELVSKRWSLLLYAKIEQRKGRRGLQFHANPETGRFDFVEEQMEERLWDYNAAAAPCRPVVNVRGFLHVSVDSPIVFADGTEHTSFEIAVARNLIPHAESSVTDTGDPVCPNWGVLHNLWKYTRQV